MKNTRIKVAVLLSIVMVIIIGVLVYYHLLYHPEKKEAGFLRMDKLFKEHREGVWTVQFSPDGKMLASGSIDSSVIIREKESGQVLLRLKHPAGVTGFEWAADFIVTGSYDGIVRVWHAVNGELLHELKGHEGTVWTVSMSVDGKSIASAGEDRVIRIWDRATGGLLSALKGHRLNIWSIKFSPDGSRLASGGFDATLRLWDVKKAKEIHIMNGHDEAVVAVAFDPGGGMLASASDDKTVKIWNTHDGKLVTTLQDGEEHVQAVAFSPDGKRLLCGGRDKSGLGELLQNFFGESHKNKGISMRLWDLAEGSLLETFSRHANDVNDVAFSPDGKWVASASADWTVSLWEVVK